MRVSARSLTIAALAGAALLRPRLALCEEFSACGTFECDESGCLIFRTSDGTPYELFIPDDIGGETYKPAYTPDHRACITGAFEGTATCEDAQGRVVESSRSPWPATYGVYSSTDEFAQGQFVNLHVGTDGDDDQLQINTWADTADPERRPRKGVMIIFCQSDPRRVEPAAFSGIHVKPGRRKNNPEAFSAPPFLPLG